MSIETLLTLGLTAALLVCAFVLRLVVLGLLGIGLRLAGKDTSWLRPQRASADTATPKERPRRPRQRRTRERAAALRPRVAATAGRTREVAAALRPLSAAAAERTRAATAAVRPRVAATSQRTRLGLGAAGATVLAVATTIWTATARGADGLERWADRTNARLAPATMEVASAAKRSAADIGKYLVAAIATIQHVVLLLAGWVHARVAKKRPAADQEPPPAPKVIDLDHDDDPLAPRSTRRPSAGARL